MAAPHSLSICCAHLWRIGHTSNDVGLDENEYDQSCGGYENYQHGERRDSGPTTVGEKAC